MVKRTNRFAALLMSVLMMLAAVIPNAGTVFASESNEGSEQVGQAETLTNEEQPAETGEAPVLYNVSIPVSNEYAVEYDNTHLNEEKTNESMVVLSYQENEQVKISVRPVENYSLVEIKATAYTGTADEIVIPSAYDNNELSFVMQPVDCMLSIAVTGPVPTTEPEATPEQTPGTEPEQTPETEPEQTPGTELEQTPGTEPEQIPETETEQTPETTQEQMPEGTFGIQSLDYALESNYLTVDTQSLSGIVELYMKPTDTGNVATKSVMLTQTFTIPDGLSVPGSLNVTGNEVTDEKGDTVFFLKNTGGKSVGLTFAQAKGRELTVALTAENREGGTVADLFSGWCLDINGYPFAITEAFTGEQPVNVHAQAIFSAADQAYADVNVEAGTEVWITGSEIMTLADTDDAVPDKFKLLVGGNTQSLVHQEDKNIGSTWKHVTFLDGADSVTRIAYCLEPRMITPGNNQTYDKGGENVKELTDGSKVTRGLYVLYGGPMWGKDVTYTDGSGKEKTANIKEIMEADGCSTNASMYFMSHMVISYLYDDARYNISPLNTSILNSKGIALAKKIAGIITGLDSTKTRMSKDSLKADKYTAGVGSVSGAVKYQAFADNVATVTLPAGISLVNETQNTTKNGTVAINGGDTFHFLVAADYSGDRKIDLTFKCRYAIDFTGYRLYLEQLQNIGFAYYSGDKNISLSLEIPEFAGSLRLAKVSANPDFIKGNGNYSLKGAQYGVYSDKGCTVKIATLTTDESGNSNVVEDVLAGTYYVREEKASKGHLIDPAYASGKAVEVKAGEETTIKSTEPVVSGKIKIQKSDAETGESRPQTSILTFKGAQYGVYSSKDCNKDALLETLKTDENGQAESRNYPIGTYFVKELTAPEGYELDSQIYTVTLSEDKASSGVDTETITSREQIIRGDISLYKILGEDMDESHIQDMYDSGKLAGIVFTLRHEDPRIDPVPITTDKYGKATTVGTGPDGKGRLIYGKWTITESNTPDGYDPIKETEISITKNNYTEEQSYVVFNDQMREFIRIYKVDAETGNKIPLKGAAFQLFDPEGKPVSMPDPNDYGTITDVFSTNERGEIALTQALPNGTYILKEVQPPVGYLIADPVEIEITGKGSYDVPLTVIVEEKPQTGKIRIVKKDAVSGQVIGEGFEFEIKVTEDIKDASGAIRKGENADGKEVELKAGTVVQRLVTEKNSMATSRELPVGKYVVTETKSGEYYAKNPAEHPAEIVGNTENEVVAVNVSVTDEKTTFELYKVDSENQDQSLSGITFRMYSSADIEAEKVDQIKAEVENLALAQTEELNRLAADQEASCRELEEAQAAELGALKEQEGVTEEAVAEMEKRQAEELAALQDTQSQEMKKLTKAHKQAQKELTDKLSQELQIDVDKMGKDYVTDENGQIHVEGLAHNTTYYIFETATLPGYNLDSTKYEFHVDESGLINGKSTYTMTLTNTANVVEISKKDITKKEELPGATLIVYDSEGNEVEKWVSTNEPHRIKGLTAGDYTLHEELAPEGYSLAEDIKFTLTDSLEVQKVEMFDDYIGIKISKQDITSKEELAGAQLTVTDADGNEVEKWTSTGEPHVFHISAGVYTLTEVVSPGNYATAESIQFTVTSENKVQHVTMYDEPIKVQISKQDITNKEELPGAHLAITDFDGNLVAEWTSTKEPHMINLAKGKYTLTETTAPKGYETAESVNFTVTDTGEIQKVTMYDSPKDSKVDLKGKKNLKTVSSGGGSTPTGGSTGSTGTAAPVKTGDDTPIVQYILLAVCAISSVCAAVIYKKKKSSKPSGGKDTAAK